MEPLKTKHNLMLSIQKCETLKLQLENFDLSGIQDADIRTKMENTVQILKDSVNRNHEMVSLMLESIKSLERTRRFMLEDTILDKILDYMFEHAWPWRLLGGLLTIGTFYLLNQL